MRVIVNYDVLRQFERKTATAFGLLRTVVDVAAPLDAAKLQNIVNELTLDRFNLAKEFLSQAQTQDLSTISGQKIAISRSYYSMYHSARTIIFHYERADVEGHDEISKRLPSTLHNRAHWSFRLNEWRERRNQVDYSPYPKDNLHVIAQQALVEAEDFLDTCAQFLRTRGVPYV